MSALASSRSTRPGQRPLAHSPAAGRLSEDIAFGSFDSPLGTVLLGLTARGIRYLALGDSAAGLERDLRATMPWASFSRNVRVPAPWRDEIVRRLRGASPRVEIPLHTEGTPFEESVWAALRRIPHGEQRSYQQIAADVGRPTASRAVAQACAHNNVAVLIPCHRVVRQTGELGGYRWGVERKQALLDAERMAAETRRPVDA
ncbi:MAG: methylated-DNA--[protein]-cysteine S-methyltransferase [Gemmatimonadaceae bacterium]|jgi:AraC family transcriptional regulator of adaptative response/methylated-DNA-[protein]-cysteine methyltransferase